MVKIRQKTTWPAAGAGRECIDARCPAACSGRGARSGLRRRTRTAGLRRNQILLELKRTNHFIKNTVCFGLSGKHLESAHTFEAALALIQLSFDEDSMLVPDLDVCLVDEGEVAQCTAKIINP